MTLQTRLLAEDKEKETKRLAGVISHDFQATAVLATVQEADEPTEAKELNNTSSAEQRRAVLGLKYSKATGLTPMQSAPIFPSTSEILAGYETIKRNKSVEIPHRPIPRIPPPLSQRPPIPLKPKALRA